MPSLMRVARDTLRPLVDLETEYRIRRTGYGLLPRKHVSAYDTVCHACVWKTGSQWLRLMLSDPTTYRYGGFYPHVWGEIRLAQFGPDGGEAMRRKVAGVTHKMLLCAAFTGYENLSHWISRVPERSAFLIRDPRELLVSWYFSTRYSHIPNPGVMKMRAEMEGMDDEAGMLHMADAFEEEFGQVINSWLSQRQAHPDQVILLRFEEFVRDASPERMNEVLTHFDIRMPESEIAGLLGRYSASKLTRKPSSHDDKYGATAQRRDWRDHIVGGVRSEYGPRLDKLAEELGYDV